MFRERTKVVRSFDSSIGAMELTAGMQTYYNYIRPSGNRRVDTSADGKYPDQSDEEPMGDDDWVGGKINYFWSFF